MWSDVNLGRVFGVRLGIHYSWFFIAVLAVLSLAAQLRATNQQWGFALVWMTAVITGLLFFGVLVIHELSHAVVARARGIPVRGITLFALGGVTQTEKEASDPKTELLVGIVGPITSGLIGLLCLGLAWTAGWFLPAAMDSPFLSVLIWLGYINILVGVFNLTPGFPLDGGRVLRAFIWRITGDIKRATRVVAGVGRVVAIALIILGLIRFFTGGGLGGLWLVFIGWFLLDAANTSDAQVELKEMLQGVRVSDAMSRDCALIDGRLNLQSFVDDVLMRTGRRCFVVGQNQHISGLITPHEIKTIERTRWPYATISDVMRPIDELRTITPDAPIVDALKVMGDEGINQMPVTSNGRLEGIVSRANIFHVLQNRTDV